MQKYKIGNVPYLNSLPLTAELKQACVEAAPSKLTEMLLKDHIDVALLPVYAILKHNLQAYPQAGLIGCDGPVRSVGFFTRPHIESLSDIESIYLDTESQSSVNLARVILKHFLDRNLKSIQNVGIDQCHKADAQVLIGDKALFFQEPGYKKWDIGELWKQHTGSGFIFACWASKKPLPSSFIQELADAKDKGTQNISEVVKACGHPKAKLIEDYLKENVAFDLTPSLQKGFEKYAEILRKENFFESADGFDEHFRMMKNHEGAPVFDSDSFLNS